ncbi:Nucleoporin SEH1 [Pleurostoma richardsiae]|uniref:Nucleoporin SEH1 n=1 Tax=Pleurostoma richardsiae TaxID=41990 RepID=A0AA38S421_9PEZI|nr:Nucleoporin SEH1 [Pleurostoma richardsiae]
MPPLLSEPPVMEERTQFELIMKHGHQDLVQAVAFNSYGDRCATGSVDGKIRVFNRHKDGIWRLCDNWTAHGGEILELQWLPPTVYPNLVASLGIEGRFKLWAEDPSAAPGRRFSNRAKDNVKAAFETKSARSPYRSFSMKHNEETRHTYLALLASDGRLLVYENEQSENLGDYTEMDEFTVCDKPGRGEETCFRVRFDPNPDPCYTALRAGMPTDALSLVVAAMDSVIIFRTRDVVTQSIGVAGSGRKFYVAARVGTHRGLIRDVAWAPGNIRGYDIIATACQDGFVRVLRVDTPFDPHDGKSWSSSELVKGDRHHQIEESTRVGSSNAQAQHSSAISHGLSRRANGDRAQTGQPGAIMHTVRELSKLDSHRTPVWRVGFDDDGQILGSVGDDGKLMCYRQVPDGSWIKSSELAMMKMRMAVPS